MSIAVVVLTYNRVHVLKQCVENVLARASDTTTEIVIWDNGSTDGTRAYLSSLSETRIAVINSHENIGINAYDKAFRMTTADYLLELDDDVIDAPPNWDKALLDAFEALPDYGYLAANLANNPHDVTAQIMYGPSSDLYHVAEVNGISLKVGPAGGWCSLTSRELYDRVGGFGTDRRFVFWHEDGRYIGKVVKLGYKAALLKDLEVVHAGGEHYAPIPASKRTYWQARDKRQERKNAIKRGLLMVPFVRSLNARRGWFVPPDQSRG